MARFDPKRPDFSPYGLGVVRWAAGLMPRPDRHNEIELNLLEHGSITYLMGGRMVTVNAGRLTAFWAAIPHQVIAIDSDETYFVATIPFSQFLQWNLPPHLVDPILHGEVASAPRSDSAEEDRRSFERWRSQLRTPKPLQQRAVLLEMEARLLRLAIDLTPRRGPAKPARNAIQAPVLSKAEEIASFIAQHYHEPISADDIGTAVGLHPNYAMNLFRKVFGSTLVEYIAQHRVSHAQRLLATTNEKIVTIAESSGFGSVSRFNEAFRRAIGCAPRDYRKSHRS